MCCRGLRVLWAARVGRAGAQLPAELSAPRSHLSELLTTSVEWPTGQSGAGGSGETSSRLVNPGTSNITRQAENDPRPQGTESLPCRARGEPSVSSAGCLQGKGFHRRKGGKMLQHLLCQALHGQQSEQFCTSCGSLED